MMKKLKTIARSAIAMALLLPAVTNAQQASMTVVGMSGQNITITGSTLYLPAGSYLNHTGNIYAAVNQFVAGNAGTTINGTSGSRFHLLGANQLDVSSPASPTLVDVNGLALDVNISIYNPQGVALSDLSFGTVSSNSSGHLTALREFAFPVLNPLAGTPVANNYLVTNSNRLIIGAAGTIAGADTNRYVVTNDNAGELRKLGLIDGQSFFFPIGRAKSDYTPARMLVASGGAVDYYMNVRNFSESIPDENIGGYATSPNVSRTWMIYGSNSNTVANMDFIHPGTPMYEVNGYDRTNSNVIRFGGNGWIPNLPNDAENQSLFGTPVNYWAQQISFGVPSALGGNSFYGKSNSLVVLPVRLGDFTVAAPACEALLNWTTLSEQNLSHFIVEKSYTARLNSWEPVAKVFAAGNSSTPKQYNLTDSKAIAAQAFYRLAIYENDGRVSYSPTRLVSFNCNTKITGYPNPVHDYFNLLLPQGSNTYMIRVTNAIGQTVLPVISKASGTTLLQTSKLSAGVYDVIITDYSGKRTTMKILKN